MSSPKAPAAPKGVAELLSALPGPAKQKLMRTLHLFVDPSAKPRAKDEDPVEGVEELGRVLREHSSSSE